MFHHIRKAFLRVSLPDSRSAPTALVGAVMLACAPAALAQGVPAVRFAVLMDPTIVDACGSCDCHADNLFSTLNTPAGAAQSIAVLDPAQLVELVSSGVTVVIPAQERVGLLGRLSVAEAEALRAAVHAGGRVLVMGDRSEHDSELIGFLAPAGSGAAAPSLPPSLPPPLPPLPTAPLPTPLPLLLPFLGHVAPAVGKLPFRPSCCFQRFRSCRFMHFLLISQ